MCLDSLRLSMNMYNYLVQCVKGKCQAIEITINESGIKERNQENQPKDQP